MKCHRLQKTPALPLPALALQGMTSESESDELDHMLLDALLRAARVEGRDMPDDVKNTILAACAACRGLIGRGVRELLMLRTVNKAFGRNVDQVCASADHVSSLRTRTSPRSSVNKKNKNRAQWRSRR